ncbi:hypothetical protein ACTWP5_27670 [Streptomyces sp. 4N509B]
MMRDKDKARGLFAIYMDGRTEEAARGGLRVVHCADPGCLATTYWLEGDRRGEKQARRWISDHRAHYGCHCKNCREDDCRCDRRSCTRRRAKR